VEKMRSHITRWVTLLTVLTGMTLYLVRPVESQYKRNSFTQWVESLQTQQDISTDLKQELHKLRTSDGNFHQMVQEASLLIAQYDEQFALPFPLDAAPSDELPRQLIVEWNLYYQLGDLLDGIAVESTKSIQSFLFWSHLTVDQPVPFARFSDLVDSILPISSIGISYLEPMIHGIAIGAP
jgi:hypothetical protein